MLLIETGANSIEKLLKEELDKVSAELAEKRAKLEELKKLNNQTGSKIREMNKEILCNFLSNPSC